MKSLEPKGLALLLSLQELVQLQAMQTQYGT
jgi:hypothetical protein